MCVCGRVFVFLFSRLCVVRLIQILHFPRVILSVWCIKVREVLAGTSALLLDAATGGDAGGSGDISNRERPKVWTAEAVTRAIYTHVPESLIMPAMGNTILVYE